MRLGLYVAGWLAGWLGWQRTAHACACTCIQADAPCAAGWLRTQACTLRGCILHGLWAVRLLACARASPAGEQHLDALVCGTALASRQLLPACRVVVPPSPHLPAPPTHTPPHPRHVFRRGYLRPLASDEQPQPQQQQADGVPLEQLVMHDILQGHHPEGLEEAQLQQAEVEAGHMQQVGRAGVVVGRSGTQSAFKCRIACRTQWKDFNLMPPAVAIQTRVAGRAGGGVQAQGGGCRRRPQAQDNEHAGAAGAGEEGGAL